MLTACCHGRHHPYVEHSAEEDAIAQNARSQKGSGRAVLTSVNSCPDAHMTQARPSTGAQPAQAAGGPEGEGATAMDTDNGAQGEAAAGKKAGGIGTVAGSKRSKAQEDMMWDEEDEDPNLLPGGTLVVCPTSVLHQWKREIEGKVNLSKGYSVHVYHGKVGPAMAPCACISGKNMRLPWDLRQAWVRAVVIWGIARIRCRRWHG